MAQLFERARLTSVFGGKADTSATLRLMPIYEDIALGTSESIGHSGLSTGL